MEWRSSKSSPCFNTDLDPFKLNQTVTFSGTLEGELNIHKSETQIEHYMSIVQLIQNGIEVILNGTVGEARGLTTLLSYLDVIDVNTLKPEILISFNKYLCQHNMDPDEVAPVRFLLPPAIYAYTQDGYSNLYSIDDSLFIHVHTGGRYGEEEVKGTYLNRRYSRSAYCTGGFRTPINEAFQSHNLSDFLMHITESLFSYNPLDSYAEHALEMHQFIHPEDKHYLHICDTCGCGQTVWDGLAHSNTEISTCDNCGDELNEDEAYYFNDNRLCSGCYHDIAFYCDRCDNDRSLEDAVYIYKDYNTFLQTVCQRCAERHYISCENCEKYYEEDYVSCYDDRSYFCDHCAETETFYCINCGKNHLFDSSQKVDVWNFDTNQYELQTVCQDCIDRDFSDCDTCGTECNNLIEGICAVCRGTTEEVTDE